MSKEIDDWTPLSIGHGAVALATEIMRALLKVNKVVVGLAVLALQFGIQPLLAKSCIPQGTPTSSLVLSGEMFKVVGALATLRAQGPLSQAFRGWTMRSCILAAGIPSVTYVVQNYCIQIAYRNLDPVVFNVLNQSKALFTAFFSFLIVGRRQSQIQILALTMVTFAGICVSAPWQGSALPVHDEIHDDSQNRNAIGIGCAILAAALSGLGSGITEWSLQRQNRIPAVLTIELSSLGCIIVMATLVSGLTADAETWRKEGLFTRWSLLTFIPVITQGSGGILVGWITKVAGGVRKVLATICGLVLTCTLQLSLPYLFGNSASSSASGPSITSVLFAVPLTAFGIYLHATFPAAGSSSSIADCPPPKKF